MNTSERWFTTPKQKCHNVKLLPCLPSPLSPWLWKSLDSQQICSFSVDYSEVRNRQKTVPLGIASLVHSLPSTQAWGWLSTLWYQNVGVHWWVHEFPSPWRSREQSPGGDAAPAFHSGWPSAPLAGLPSAGDKSIICCSRSSDTQCTHRHWDLTWAQSHPTHVQQPYRRIGS